ncbi:MAG: hypothetical protein JSS64_02465 [Bacteroidetes bacterium]|nr:hypothetical protein [Bacteroidota bacterium]
MQIVPILPVLETKPMLLTNEHGDIQSFKTYGVCNGIWIEQIHLTAPGSCSYCDKNLAQSLNSGFDPDLLQTPSTELIDAFQSLIYQINYGAVYLNPDDLNLNIKNYLLSLN